MPKKCQTQAKAKRDGVINPQNYNLRQILMFSKRHEPTEVDRGTPWSTSSDTH